MIISLIYNMWQDFRILFKVQFLTLPYPTQRLSNPASAARCNILLSYFPLSQSVTVVPAFGLPFIDKSQEEFQWHILRISSHWRLSSFHPSRSSNFDFTLSDFWKFSFLFSPSQSVAVAGGQTPLIDKVARTRRPTPHGSKLSRHQMKMSSFFSIIKEKTFWGGS